MQCYNEYIRTLVIYDFGWNAFYAIKRIRFILIESGIDNKNIISVTEAEVHFLPEKQR